MKVKYYKDTDSLYIDLFENASTDSMQVSEVIVLDYDMAGKLVGIDIDNASTKVELDKLTVSNLPGSVETDTVQAQPPFTTGSIVDNAL